MKDIFVQNQNVQSVVQAINAAKKERGPKIILQKGRPGLGKTKTCAWYAAHNDVVYLEAEAGWNIGWFLDDLCFELGIQPEHKLSNRSRQVKDLLRKERPVLIIDEADLLKHDKKVLETIKSIHDKCEIPVVLVGTNEIEQAVRSYPQFISRVCQIVEFKEIDKGDLATVVNQLAEIDIPDEAIEELSQYVKTMRDVVRYIPHIERAVKSRPGKSKVDRAIVRAAAVKVPGSRQEVA